MLELSSNCLWDGRFICDDCNSTDVVPVNHVALTHGEIVLTHTVNQATMLLLACSSHPEMSGRMASNSHGSFVHVSCFYSAVACFLLASYISRAHACCCGFCVLFVGMQSLASGQ